MVNTVLGPRGRASRGGRAVTRNRSGGRTPRSQAVNLAGQPAGGLVAEQFGQFAQAAGAERAVHPAQEGLVRDPAVDGTVAEHPDRVVAVLVGGAEGGWQRVRRR